MLTLAAARASDRATITIREVAELSGVDPRTVSGALSVNGGEIPARRIGRRIVIPRAAFLAWFEGESVGRNGADAAGTATAAEAPAVDAVATVRAKLVEILSALEANA